SVIGCTGCHTSGGEQGPQWDKFLAGGMKFQAKEYGTLISRNLTPDPQTGLAKRSDEYLKRLLQSGIIDEERLSVAMPWPALSNLTEEDRYAIIVYLRNMKPVKHEIPEPMPAQMPEDTKAGEVIWGADYAKH
ncbi:MAG: c-type cytochrome, partial [Bacteroidetes bacterium]